MEEYDFKIERMEGKGVVIRGEGEKGKGRDRGRSMMVYEGMNIGTKHNIRKMT